MNPLELLFDGRLIEYIGEIEKKYPAETSTWFLVHIPKTAGSSFREELADVCQPDINVEVNYKALNGGEAGKSFDKLILEAVEDLGKVMDRTHIPFASGHVLHRDLVTRLDPSRVIYTSILRNPIDRLLSDYHYRTGAEHPQYQQELRRYPTFSEFVRDPVNQNVMCNFLKVNPQAGVEETIADIQQNFGLIGTMEFYPVVLKVQMALLGCRARFTHSIRRSGASSQSRRDNVSPEDMALVSQTNSVDIAIYQHFNNRWAKVAPKLHYFFDFDRIFKMRAGLPYSW